MSKNITLSVDADVLAKVRRIAAGQDTTVNALVRDYLCRMADHEDRAKKARLELAKLSENATWNPGPDFKWSREEIHDEALSRHKHLDIRGAKSP